MTFALAEQKVRQYKDQTGRLADVLPEAAQAYHQWTGQCFAPGELDARTKHLIALAVALYANHEVCTFYHLGEARSEGATDCQIMETAAVAAAAASGHVLAQGAVGALGALKPAERPSSGFSAGGLQDYLQDTEFADAWEEALGPNHAVSPSY